MYHKICHPSISLPIKNSYHLSPSCLDCHVSFKLKICHFTREILLMVHQFAKSRIAIIFLKLLVPLLKMFLTFVMYLKPKDNFSLYRTRLIVFGLRRHTADTFSLVELKNFFYLKTIKQSSLGQTYLL